MVVVQVWPDICSVCLWCVVCHVRFMWCMWYERCGGWSACCVLCVLCGLRCVWCVSGVLKNVWCACGMVSVLVSAVCIVCCVSVRWFVTWVTSDLFRKFCLEDEYFLAPEMRARQLNSIDQKERLTPSLRAQHPSVAPRPQEQGFELLDLHQAPHLPLHSHTDVQAQGHFLPPGLALLFLLFGTALSRLPTHTLSTWKTCHPPTQLHPSS